MKNLASRNILITGGAGFIGSNLAAYFLTQTSAHVHVYDNLSRPGVELNLAWLSSLADPSRLTLTRGDVRNNAELQRAARQATEIYHFAAQVAVTTSIADPVGDCEVNVLGTLNVLEAARLSRKNPFVLFTSTNKVYGSLSSLEVDECPSRYGFRGKHFSGIDESWPLDFHSPYGCSKGAADQYVHDYARIYDLPTVVFRMSCIAGPRQLGTEDQGWLAHFLYSALRRHPITIYGDGRQVRDVLHVHDLIRAICAVSEHRETTAGQIYNVGGGLNQSFSVLEALDSIQQITGKGFNIAFSAVRPGDQKIYITDCHKLQEHTGWKPQRNLETIIRDIAHFWAEHLSGDVHEEPIKTERVA